MEHQAKKILIIHCDWNLCQVKDLASQISKKVETKQGDPDRWASR